jgi:hypothetical protein
MRQKRANRGNAASSTGPKSVAGKLRVGQNALRHGLSVAVLGDVALSQEVEAVARKIAGNSASAASIECARRIAEAEVDL